jgi:hypothetical protein
MNKTKIKDQLQKLIKEAASKNMWLSHKGQGIIISPLQLSNSISDNKYLVLIGWMMIPEEEIGKRLLLKVEMAKNAVKEFSNQVQLTHKFYNDEKEVETTLTVVPNDDQKL